MKTSVNLYSPDLHPKLRLLSLPIVLGFWGLVLIGAVIIFYLNSSEQENLQRQLNQIELANQQQQALLASLVDELNTFSADKDLLEQVSIKQQMLNLKKRVFAELAGQEQVKTTGFASLMSELAEKHHKNIWLKRIYLNEQNITIEGATSQSSSVPEWVNSLSRAEYFQGQTFSKTHIYRDEEQVLQFVLAAGEIVTPAKAVPSE